MMGRQNNDQGHLFYEFRLDERFLTIIWCARSTAFLILRESTQNLRRTIRCSAGLRLIRCL